MLVLGEIGDGRALAAGDDWPVRSAGRLGSGLSLRRGGSFLRGLGLLFQHEAHAEDDDAHGDVDVRHVEHGEGPAENHKIELEHVHHIAADDAVDAVADGAGHDQHGHPAGQGVGDDVLHQNIDHHQAEEDAEDHEEPARSL